MSYKENEVVAKYTKGAFFSDCGEYNVQDLLEMFDETEITVDKLGNTDGVTVNDCIENNLVYPGIGKLVEYNGPYIRVIKQLFTTN